MHDTPARRAARDAREKAHMLEQEAITLVGMEGAKGPGRPEDHSLLLL